MSDEETRASLGAAKDSIDDVLNALPPVVDPPPPVVVITTPAAFDVALAAAVAGTVLTLDPALVITKAVVIPAGVRVESSLHGEARMTKDEPAPSFTGGLRVLNADVELEGLQITIPVITTDVVVLGAMRPTLTRCRILGDPVLGVKRGIAANGGAMTIRKCYIADCWQPAQDAQAIGAWDMIAPGLEIDDCYLEGAAETVMFGGADPLNESRTPSQITLTNSTLTKNPAWYGKAQIKCALEFKNAKHVVVENCILEYAGINQGQGAYLIDATVRNQGNTAPYSTVEDVVIRHCHGAHAAGILNVLGSDNVHPSGTIDGLTIEDCTFDDITKAGVWAGAGRLFQFDRAPKNVKLRRLTVTGGKCSAWGYFLGTAPPTGLELTALTLPASTYQWKLDGGIPGGGSGRAALLRYMPDAQLDAGIV